MFGGGGAPLARVNPATVAAPAARRTATAYRGRTRMAATLASVQATRNPYHRPPMQLAPVLRHRGAVGFVIAVVVAAVAIALLARTTARRRASTSRGPAPRPAQAFRPARWRRRSREFGRPSRPPDGRRSRWRRCRRTPRRSRTTACTPRTRGAARRTRSRSEPRAGPGDRAAARPRGSALTRRSRGSAPPTARSARWATRSTAPPAGCTVAPTTRTSRACGDRVRAVGRRRTGRAHALRDAPRPRRRAAGRRPTPRADRSAHLCDPRPRDPRRRPAGPAHRDHAERLRGARPPTGSPRHARCWRR